MATGARDDQNQVFTYAFFAENSEKHAVDDTVFLVDYTSPLKDASTRRGFDFPNGSPELTLGLNVFSRTRTMGYLDSNIFITLVQKLARRGSNLSIPHGTSYAERDHKKSTRDRHAPTLKRG
jgi:hypothetical protein